MEELRKFPRQKFIEHQKIIMELSGRLQELQNEVNCMNDSKDFQDAESVRSGNSHVTNQPILFSKHPFPEGILSLHSYRRAAKKGCQTFGIHLVYQKNVIGNVFANPHASSSALYPQELNPPWKKSLKSRFTCLQRRRVIDRNEIKI